MMFICIARDSGGIRTHDPQLRRLLLYPTELRNHRQNLNELSLKSFASAKLIHLFLFSKSLSNFICFADWLDNYPKIIFIINDVAP